MSPRAPRLLLSAAIAAGVSASGALGPSAARAHGGSPIATDVHVAGKGAEEAFQLESTFGLFSRDARGEWRLACEEAVSPGVKSYLVLPDGRVGMAHAGGFAVSDDGCTFRPATGVGGSGRAVALVHDPAGTGVIFVLRDVVEPGRSLVRSRDRGESFELVSTPAGWLVGGIHADASRPGRLLAVAQQRPGVQALLDSGDAGETWRLLPLPSGDGFFRLLGAGPSGVFLVHSVRREPAIWRAEPDGTGFAPVLALANPPTFLSEVATGRLWTAAGRDELFRSDDSGRTWTAVPGLPDVNCVEPFAGGLLACVYDVSSTSGALASTDDGASWTPAFRYDEVVGLRECPPESDVGRACPPLWDQLSFALRYAPDSWPAAAPPRSASGCASDVPSRLAAVAAAAWFARRRTGLRAGRRGR